MRLLLVACLFFAFSCYAGFSDTVYTATLTGSQIKPDESYSIGNSFCNLDRRDVKVSYILNFTVLINLSFPVNFKLSCATQHFQCSRSLHWTWSKGSYWTTIILLCNVNIYKQYLNIIGFNKTIYSGSNVHFLEASWTIEETESFSVEDQIEDFLSGLFYIVVSSGNDTAIARGQLEQSVHNTIEKSRCNFSQIYLE